MLKLLLKFGKKLLLVLLLSALLVSTIFTTKSYSNYSENSNRNVQVVIRAGEWQNSNQAKVGKRYTWGNDMNISQHGLKVTDIPSDIPLRFEDNQFFISEADINMKTGKAIARKLADKGIEVDFQYANKKSEDLNSAGIIASKKNPKIYLSIHHNSFKTDTNGYFFMSNQGDVESSKFAQRLSESIKYNGKVKQNSNRANDGYIGELNKVGRTGRLSVLAELGYFSNPNELKVIMSDEYVDYISTQIANEVSNQLGEILVAEKKSEKAMEEVISKGYLMNSSDKYNN